jgi:hypothetical protein
MGMDGVNGPTFKAVGDSLGPKVHHCRKITF